ncbi:MAG TPA: Gmad2 immunoglobulin-like domain-containing protein [Anaerolineales bacterium]|nr:Gmad2 immunoglobulin-like domain-containing protein [Anaerolineales bacterium]
MKTTHLAITALVLGALACGSAQPTPAVEPTISLPTSTSSLPPATPTAPTTGAPPEAILVSTPGNGSRLVGAVHVEGEADPTFEQTLVVQVTALDVEPFAVLAQQSVMIGADVGQRGPFVADLTFDLGDVAERPGAVNVFSVSPRDGAIAHLASMQVTLAAAGEETIRVNDHPSERIAIFAPLASGLISGGTAHIEGFALASFEQTLLVEIVDVDGTVVGAAPVTVQAPDVGFPGSFAVDVPYSLTTAGPGRVVVRDISPAFGQDLHLASVEVDLEP